MYENTVVEASCTGSTIFNLRSFARMTMNFDSDSDDDLTDFAPSGLSQSSHTSEPSSPQKKKQIDDKLPVSKEEQESSSEEILRRGALRCVDPFISLYTVH